MSTPGYGDTGYKVPQRSDISSASSLATIIAAIADTAGAGPDKGPGSGSGFLITGMCLSTSGAGAITFQSDGTVLGRNTFKATDPALVLPFNPDGWFKVAIGENFKIGNASTLTLTGFVTYIKLGKQ